MLEPSVDVTVPMNADPPAPDSIVGVEGGVTHVEDGVTHVEGGVTQLLITDDDATGKLHTPRNFQGY